MKDYDQGFCDGLEAAAKLVEEQAWMSIRENVAALLRALSPAPTAPVPSGPREGEPDVTERDVQRVKRVREALREPPPPLAQPAATGEG